MGLPSPACAPGSWSPVRRFSATRTRQCELVADIVVGCHVLPAPLCVVLVRFSALKCVLTVFVKSSDQLVSSCPLIRQGCFDPCPVHVLSDPMVHTAHLRLRLCRCVQSCLTSRAKRNAECKKANQRCLGKVL